MSHTRRLITEEWYKHKFEGAKTSLCINCGKMGDKHHLEIKMGGAKWHCPTKFKDQFHLNKLFERGTALEYLERQYERKHGLQKENA